MPYITAKADSPVCLCSSANLNENPKLVTKSRASVIHSNFLQDQLKSPN